MLDLIIKGIGFVYALLLVVCLIPFIVVSIYIIFEGVVAELKSKVSYVLHWFYYEKVFRHYEVDYCGYLFWSKGDTMPIAHSTMIVRTIFPLTKKAAYKLIRRDRSLINSEIVMIRKIDYVTFKTLER